METTRWESTNIGAVDTGPIEKEIQVTIKKERETYHKWTPQDRFKMQRRMETQQQFVNLKLNFLVLMKVLYVNLRKGIIPRSETLQKRKDEVTKLIPKYSSQTGRPLLIGDLNSMVQTYIKKLSNSGGVVDRAIANATAQALLTRYPNIVGEIDVSSASWAQSLFRIMGFKSVEKLRQ